MIDLDCEATNEDRLFEIVEGDWILQGDKTIVKAGFLGEDFDDFILKFIGKNYKIFGESSKKRYKKLFETGQNYRNSPDKMKELCESKAGHIIDELCDMPDEVLEIVKKWILKSI